MFLSEEIWFISKVKLMVLYLSKPELQGVLQVHRICVNYNAKFQEMPKHREPKQKL